MLSGVAASDRLDSAKNASPDCELTKFEDGVFAGSAKGCFLSSLHVIEQIVLDLDNFYQLEPVT